MTTIVSIAQGGTGARTAANARIALDVPPSAAYDQANTARTQANTAYGQANAAYGQANAAYGQANAAYGAANTRLSASGGTLSGDLIITGNLTVSGNSTTLNTEILTVEDADVVLLSNVAGTPALNAGVIVNRGTSTNTFLRWNEVTDRWGWSDDGTAFVPFANAVLKTGDTMTGNLTISGATLNTATANITTIVTGNALTISTGTASNGNIIFSANGTEDMRITAPGNVGIGTISPGQRLDVAARIRIRSDGTNSAGAWLTDSSGTENVFTGLQGTSATSPWGVFSNSAWRLTILNDGNVGIGTTNPSQQLELSGNIFINAAAGNPFIEIKTAGAGNNPYLKLTANTNYWELLGAFSQTNDDLLIRYNGTTFVNITNVGNVGVGTTNPSQKFEVAGTVRGEILNCYGSSDPQSTSPYFYQPLTGTLGIGASGAERVRIDANGNVTIGTSNTSFGGLLVTQTGISSNLAGVQIYRDTGGYGAMQMNGTNGGYIDFATPGIDYLGRIIYFNSTNTMSFITTVNTRMQIYGDGNVSIGTSSASYKVDIAGSTGYDITSDSATILRVRSTTGRYPTFPGETTAIALTKSGEKYGWRILSQYVSDTYAGADFHIQNSLDVTPTWGSKLTITAAGGVGIGITNPSNNFHVRAQLFYLDKVNYTAEPTIRFRSANDSYVTEWGVGQLSSSNHFGFRYFDGSSWNERVRLQTDGFVMIGTASSLTYGGVFQVYRSSTGTGQNVISFTQAGSSSSEDFTMYASSASYTNSSTAGWGVQRIIVSRSKNSAYNFATYQDGAGDVTHYFRGDGQAYADGSWNGGGADYAEYFESVNGEQLTEGATVVLENNKVRESTIADLPDSIIGVVRPKRMGKTSVVVGNNYSSRWAQKFLTDDFDCYIMEDYSVIDWKEEFEDGSFKDHSYELDKIPEGITPPENAVIKTHDDNNVKLQRPKINPEWDPEEQYVPRENRPEWNIIGLVGQVKILKGQLMNSRWIKMRDVSVNVEEWMIR